MKKLASVVALSGLASLCFASFEMALVCDSNGHDIDRYDPQTGVYLGSFGGNVLSVPSDISINQATNTAYVVEYSLGRVYAFDYNTGELQQTWIHPSAYYVSKLSNGELLIGGYGNVNTTRYAPDGAALGTVTTSSLYVEGHAETTSGNVWYLNGGGTKSLYRGALGSNTISFAANLVGLSTLPAYLSSYGAQLAAMDFNGGTATRLYSWQTTGSVLGTESSVLISNATGVSAGGTAIGHAGLVYGTLNASTRLMYRWMPGTSYTTNFALTQTQNAAGMALVVAPEPASFLVLGFGLVPLLRRRRRG